MYVWFVVCIKFCNCTYVFDIKLLYMLKLSVLLKSINDPSAFCLLLLSDKSFCLQPCKVYDAMLYINIFLVFLFFYRLMFVVCEFKNETHGSSMRYFLKISEDSFRDSDKVNKSITKKKKTKNPRLTLPISSLKIPLFKFNYFQLQL